jgi:hypothetical protein
MFLQGKPLPFQLGVFEIQKETHPELRNAQIIQHLAALMIGNPLYDFCIYNDFAVRDQIRCEFSHAFTFVEHFKATLLVKGNPAALELDDERILVALFIQSMPKFVDHLEGATDDLMRFLFVERLTSAFLQVRRLICVHLCLSVVETLLSFDLRETKTPRRSNRGVGVHGFSGGRYKVVVVSGLLAMAGRYPARLVLANLKCAQSRAKNRCPASERAANVPDAHSS